MKLTIKVKKEIEIKYVKLSVGVRHDNEDMPYKFPFRKADRWCPTIDIDKGQIIDWELGVSIDLHMKVCDDGFYYLMDENKKVVFSIDDYVPNKLIPGSYGDYIEMKIDESGIITNWNINANLNDFKKAKQH